MAYFVIISDEDGIHIHQYATAQEVVDHITPNAHGEAYYGPALTFLETLPQQDKGSFYQVPESAILIIHGNIVVPTPTTVVKTYTLP